MLEAAGFSFFPVGMDIQADPEYQQIKAQLATMPLDLESELFAYPRLFVGIGSRLRTPQLVEIGRSWQPDMIIREAGEAAKQFKLTAMIEFARNSTFIATLTTALKLIREAAHGNVKPMLDCYHFWSGLNKFEDLDLLQPNELAHVHFQDVPDMPRELLDNTTRLIPGDGVSPLVKILKKIQEKGYAGPLSVELFLPEFQQGDPYEVAKRIREKAEGVMRQARVL